MRSEAYKDFILMRDSALKENINLTIVSATRNFSSQKNIWENKWKGITLVDNQNLKESIPNEIERFKKIIQFSSVPGTSRHHFGSDIDINSVEPNYFETVKGKREYDWLSKNASAFGFCQPYNEGRSAGYEEEKWHWSYLPISKGLLQDYIKLVKTEDIKGFLGDKYVTQVDVINNYVLSINPECI
jgi:LAS superfamily LD-carboxypeptidase LdcB